MEGGFIVHYPIFKLTREKRRGVGEHKRKRVGETFCLNTDKFHPCSFIVHWSY